MEVSFLLSQWITRGTKRTNTSSFDERFRAHTPGANGSIIPIPMWSLSWRSSSSVKELGSALAVYEPLVWIAGGLVLLGVVLEVVADRKVKDTRSGDSLKKWGEYLLIIGLAGEIGFGIATADLSGLIIAKLNIETAKLLAQIQPRELSVEQQREIGESLRDFAGKDIPLFVDMV